LKKKYEYIAGFDHILLMQFCNYWLKLFLNCGIIENG